jgi:TonB family protein
MRSAAAALLMAGSLSAVVPAAPQEPSPSPASSSPSGTSDVKVAGRDVPAPKRTHFLSPVFPPEAQAAGQRGIVILELLIDTTGKVVTADVLRSVPPFDDAALVAARQWEYEVTKVDGKPVPVRLTVPITFALRLPEMTRETGIPELRQGAVPAFPAGARGPATVVADVTLLPDGTLAEAAIKEGDSPFAEMILQTLRTWRFGSDPDAPPVSFQVRAEFQAGPPSKVELRLFGLRTAERKPAADVTPPPAAGVPPAPVATPAPVVPSPIAAPPVAPSPVTPSPVTASAGTPPPVTPPAVVPPHALPSPAAPAPGVTPAPPVTAPVTASPAPTQNPPVAASPRPEGALPSPGAPPVEVIPGGPVASPAPGAASGPAAAPRIEQGVSAVRDVALGSGVPDLTKGRRPVAPPFARMSSATGTVQIQFSVDASGGTSIQNVAGPDLLKEAARQAVASWGFRRTSPERLYLLAVFTYDGDRAQAEVKRAE